MKKHLIILLASYCYSANASVEDPKSHIMELAKAQTDSNYERLYNLFEEATGEEHFSERLKSNGGEEEFIKILKKYFTPYDADSLWVADSVEKAIELKPEQKGLLSPYKTVKPGFLIVFVGDKENLSYYFFKEEKSTWRLVTPEDYAPLPHS